MPAGPVTTRPTPAFLDACDSLGMLVLDENRSLNSSPEYMSQFERMILRDRNHPSVFLWSIGNEEGWIQTNSHRKTNCGNLTGQNKENWILPAPAPMPRMSEMFSPA